jgi:hypothetical protein
MPTWNDILKKIVINIFSEHFLILMVSFYFVLAKIIDLPFFCALNGFAYSGSIINGYKNGFSNKPAIQPVNNEVQK